MNDVTACLIKHTQKTTKKLNSQRAPKMCHLGQKWGFPLTLASILVTQVMCSIKDNLNKDYTIKISSLKRKCARNFGAAQLELRQMLGQSCANNSPLFFGQGEYSPKTVIIFFCHLIARSSFRDDPQLTNKCITTVLIKQDWMNHYYNRVDILP